MTLVEFSDLQTVTFSHIGARMADEGELARLTPFLAVGVDDRNRIRSGDACIWTANDQGDPIGVAWVNLESHSDRYLGKWSRPDSTTAYFNQLFVSPDSRGQGDGRKLIMGALWTAAHAGRQTMRSAIPDGNETRLNLHREAGFELGAKVIGIRLGSSLTLRFSKGLAAQTWPRTDHGPR